MRRLDRGIEAMMKALFSFMKKGDKLGIPEGVDSVYPRLSKAQRLSSDCEIGTPEAEGLMTVKGVSYQVEPV